MSARHLFASSVLVSLLLLGATGPGRSQTAAFPTSDQQVEERLKTFDPEAVAAARHYYESPRIKEGMLGMLRNFPNAIIANEEKAHGTTLSEAYKEKLAAAANKAVADNFHLLVDMSMVAGLEVLSKDELVALDEFYSSPRGQSIMSKMSRIGQRMPAIVQVWQPKFMASLAANMKASGAEAP